MLLTTHFLPSALQSGCTDVLYNVTLPLGGCSLVRQPLSEPKAGRAPPVVQVPGIIGGMHGEV